MTPADYLAHDAVGLAHLIASREVSAAEVLDAALSRAEAANGKVNAIVLDLADRARADAARAGAAGGPLAGVPFLLKDLGAQLAGTATSSGSALFAGRPATSDSALDEAYRRAGLVIFGKTNTPELGLEPVTEPTHFGPCRNPWSLERTAGGSSGGAAAAVAAGIVPAAHASDGGGSIRIPASCCGLFGMKPSRGRVSAAPAGEGWGGFSTTHAVTRTVRDSAALLDVACKPQPGDPYWAPPPERPFLEEVSREPGRLRIGFTTQAIASGAISEDCAAAVRAAAGLCEGLGHDVREVRLEWAYGPVQRAASAIVAASVAATLDAEAERRGRAIESGEVEPATWAMSQTGRGLAAAGHVLALQTAHAFGRRVAQEFSTLDVILTSTLGMAPPPVGWLSGGGAAEYVSRLFAFMPNTQAFNVSGNPAMSVPLALSSEGLPIGVQFVAAQAAEALLFRLAAQLEAAAPWPGLAPAFAA
ncbi:MAG TPA: amidase [Caulobacteraceae bacterium]|jgi:amidase|nr:amidase [Caulobacteraceae bacterium]